MKTKSKLGVLRIIGRERNWYYLKNIECGSLIDLFIVTLKLFFKCVKVTRIGKINAKVSRAMIKLTGLSHRRLYDLQLQNMPQDYIEVQNEKIIFEELDKFPERIISIFDLLILSSMLLKVFIFPRKRRNFLLFYWTFYTIIDKNLKYINNFPDYLFTYNDQDLVTSSIVTSLRQNGTYCVVMQHGLILDSEGYFPCNSNEFWAWGTCSFDAFQSKNRNCAFFVTGRLQADVKRFSSTQKKLFRPQQKILIAVGSRWKDIYLAIKKIRSSSLEQILDIKKFSIKYHPGTKCKIIIKILIKFYFSRINEEKGLIEQAVDKYDILYTRNSTVLLDFLLCGKPVLLLEKRVKLGALQSHCSTLDELILKKNDIDNKLLKQNKNRIAVLNDYLQILPK